MSIICTFMSLIIGFANLLSREALYRKYKTNKEHNKLHLSIKGIIVYTNAILIWIMRLKYQNYLRFLIKKTMLYGHWKMEYVWIWRKGNYRTMPWKNWEHFCETLYWYVFALISVVLGRFRVLMQDERIQIISSDYPFRIRSWVITKGIRVNPAHDPCGQKDMVGLTTGWS